MSGAQESFCFSPAYLYLLKYSLETRSITTPYPDRSINKDATNQQAIIDSVMNDDEDGCWTAWKVANPNSEVEWNFGKSDSKGLIRTVTMKPKLKSN